MIERNMYVERGYDFYMLNIYNYLYDLEDDSFYSRRVESHQFYSADNLEEYCASRDLALDESEQPCEARWEGRHYLVVTVAPADQLEVLEGWQEGRYQMTSGEFAYDKMLTFVKENLEYFEMTELRRVEEWGECECERVVKTTLLVMRNLSAYEDVDFMMKMGNDEFVDAFGYVCGTDGVDLEDHLFDKCASVQAIVGLCIKGDIIAEKPYIWIGNVTYDGWALPVYRDGTYYAIDLGGSVGMTDFIQFATQNEAFAAFEKAVRGEE